MEHCRAETGLRTWKLVVSYDGSDFHGWQVQPGLVTVQGELARVIREVVGETVLPQGSGRTDTGVHAEGQVVSLQLAAAIPAERLQRALNRRLPGSVRVLSAFVVPESFHARGNVAWKRYTYRVFSRRKPGGEDESICPPLLSRTVWDCRWPLCLEPMQRAAASVVGTHDFSSFAAHHLDRSDRKTMGDEQCAVRTVFASSWSEEDGLLVYRVVGNGFLHHMVRVLVGTFVEVGVGRRPAESMDAVLAARSRAAAGVTAPPQGLSLTRVVYRDEPDAVTYGGARS